MPSVVVTGDRLSGFVLPIEPVAGNLSMDALRATTWTVDDTLRVLLEGDVTIRIGSYHFTSKEAAVWLNRLPSADGVINQVAVYFNETRDPTKRAGLGVEGRKLLVTASTRGEVTVNSAVRSDRRPRSTPFLADAEARLARHLTALLDGTPTLRTLPEMSEPPKPADFDPRPGGAVEEKDVAPPRVELPPASTELPWLSDPQATVSFSAGLITIEPSETETIITASDGITIDYVSRRRADEFGQLSLSAERAVIFADPVSSDDASSGQLSASVVRGIYLEGNVVASALEEAYTVRAPRMYYDFRTGRAVMLNAILRTTPRDLRGPVYARASEMRQLSDDQWEARDIRVSTSEFHTPHIAIGADRMTVSRRESDDASDIYLDGRGMTARAMNMPFLYLPRFAGTVADVPLKELEVGTRDNDGVRILTTWDLFTLIGVDQPEGVEADLRVDGYTKRGAGGGVDLRYDIADSEGTVELYGLYDTGIDRTTSGIEVDPDDEFRGIALLQNHTQLSRYWSLQAQGSLISDESFVPAWYRDEFVERLEYETSLYLKHQKDRAAFTVLAKNSFNDFLANDYLLASRGYTVDKLPELTYRRVGDSLFNDRLSYFTENRLTRMRLAFDRSTPAELGARARAFGIGADDEISDSLRAQGLEPSFVNRLDSRHELTLPMEYGPVGITPFIVGRFTGYDDDFDSFSSDSDSMRFFGAAGVRIGTQFQRVYNNAQSRLFDITRLRHIVEPSITLWTSYASVSQDDLPVYDEDVESLADGSAVRLGVKNTFQTQRGGPGQWRSVDVFTWDNAVVIDTSDSGDRESPTPQWFEYRPEFSQLGDHWRTAVQWLPSDNLAFSVTGTYDLEESLISRSSAGVELRHSPVFTTYVEYRFIDASENELVSLGWNYQITPKYFLALTPQYDLREDDLRSLTGRLTRRFPDFDFILYVRYDRIEDDTTLGASMGLVEF